METLSLSTEELIVIPHFFGTCEALGVWEDCITSNQNCALCPLARRDQQSLNQIIHGDEHVYQGLGSVTVSGFRYSFEIIRGNIYSAKTVNRPTMG